MSRPETRESNSPRPRQSQFSKNSGDSKKNAPLRGSRLSADSNYTGTTGTTGNTANSPGHRGSRLSADVTPSTRLTTHHGGDLETLAQEREAVARRIGDFEARQARQRHEEKEEVIREQYEAGEIDDEEAHMRLARNRMHAKADDEKTAMHVDESAAAGADYATTQQMLEDVMDTEDKNPCTRWIKKVTGWTHLMRLAAKERNRRQKPTYKHKFPWIEKLVHGHAMRLHEGDSKDQQDTGSIFEVVIGLVLLINGGLIGVQASIDEEVMFFDIMEHIFTAVFVLELILRLLSDGWIWFVEGLNFFDFLLIIVTGIIPMWILAPLNIKANFMRMVQVLRILRLIKLVRMVRTVSMFRIFWSLIRGLLDSGRTLLWTYIMIGGVLYIFAIFGVYLIGKDLAIKNSGDQEAIDVANEYFGDVPKTFVTLFQTMTLDSWTSIARPLMRHSDVVAPYFILVILVVVLALGNLVTAVIIENAKDASAEDQELVAREKRDEKMREIADLREIFYDIDSDGSGMLSKEEYLHALHSHEGIQQKFEILGLGDEEQQEVFELLDLGDGEIGVEKFCQGLRDMQGDAKAKDSFTICKKVGHINKALSDLSVKLQQQQAFADELSLDIAEAHRQMGGMLLDVRDVMQYLTFCMPPDEVKRTKQDLERLEETMAEKKLAIQYQNEQLALAVTASQPVGRNNKSTNSKSYYDRVSGKAKNVGFTGYE